MLHRKSHSARLEFQFPTSPLPMKSVQNGGEGGIRTHGTVARTPHFECGAFDHSATSPREIGTGRTGAGAGRTRRSSSARLGCLDSSYDPF